MRKTIVCIFAHPDDEAFMVPGTIYKLSKRYNIILLCATRGQAGKDSEEEKETKLSKRRADELLASAKILGVKKVHFLGFRDGTLSNNHYHKLAAKIQKKLEYYNPEIILTIGPTGISGHLDHIAVSLVTTYVFHKIPFIKEIMYAVTTRERSERFKHGYFIHFPEGTPRSKVKKIVDVSDVWETKVKAMMVHKSQRHDAERILRLSRDLPKEEYFLVTRKKS